MTLVSVATARVSRETAVLISRVLSVFGPCSHLTSLAQSKGSEVFLADATVYLEFFGIIAIAWQRLLQAIVVQKSLEKKLSVAETNFYQGKLFTFRYFFSYEIPKIKGLAKRLMDKDALTVEMNPTYFAD